MSKPDFQDDIKTIRNKNNLPDDGFVNAKAAEIWKVENIHLKLNAWEKIDNSITTMLHKYHLGPIWHHSLKRYLLLNNPDDMQLPTEIQVGMKRDMDTGRWQVVMYIPEDASQAEIRAVLPQVSEWQRRIHHKKELKRQPAPYTALARQAFEAHEQLRSYEKVGQKLGISASRARDLVRNFKNQAGIN